MRQQQDTQVIYTELNKDSNLHPDMVDQIEKDIKRTFFPAYHKSKEGELPDKEIFELLKENEEMREQTKRILVAYAAYDKKTGYIQGFNSIVAAILYSFHQAKEELQKLGIQSPLSLKLKFDEEEVFYTFFGLMTLLGWREKFMSGMDDIAAMCDDFSQRLLKEDQTLYKRFFSNHVNPVY